MVEIVKTLRIDPFQLPTAQHRAGLAGLILLCDTMRRRDIGPLPAIEPAGKGAYEVSLTNASLQALMNEYYNASWEEQRSATVRKDRNKQPVTPKRTETALDEKTGREKTYYIYDGVTPKAGFLTALGMSSPWVKLWRDAVWSTLRGVPKTRLPFERRAEGEDVGDAGKLWTALLKSKEPALYLAGSLMVGAQAENAERVPFQGRPAENFLLHFWPVAMGVFQTLSIDRDGKESQTGYVLAVPDIANYEEFCLDFSEFAASLSSEIAGFRPRASLISIPEEGGLEFGTALAAVARARHGEGALSFSTAGIEIYHLAKRGNNIPLLHAGRVPMDAGILQSYEAIRNRYSHPIFKRQLILNLLRGKDWYAEFGDVFSRHPKEWFVGSGSRRFQADIQRRIQLTKEA
jgi:CRISPR-associated protein Cmx8